MNRGWGLTWGGSRWRQVATDLTWSHQVRRQLEVGRVRELIPMVRGLGIRAELELEAMAWNSARLRPLVDRVSARRLVSAWANESARPGGEDLSAHESRRFSQNGEDGILEWIFDRIGPTNRYFVEIGASDGEENCTRNLVEGGWSGTWVEADSDKARHASRVATDRVVVIDEAAEPHTIASTLRRAGVPPHPDLVVVDIDGNDWWVVDAILSSLSPRVLVAEYNSTYQPGRWWVQPYRRLGGWDESFRHGASLDAIASLAQSFGLVLVGCDSTGVNSFYLSREEVPKLGPEAPGRIEAMYRAPWFAPGLWGHPRRMGPASKVQPAEPFSGDDRRRVSLVAAEWPAGGAKKLRPGQPAIVEAIITNGAGKEISSEGSTPFRLASRWRSRSDPRDPWFDEPRQNLEPVPPGATVRFRVWNKAPQTGGSYRLELSLVQEHVGWLDHQDSDIEFTVED